MNKRINIPQSKQTNNIDWLSEYVYEKILNCVWYGAVMYGTMVLPYDNPVIWFKIPCMYAFFCVIMLTIPMVCPPLPQPLPSPPHPNPIYWLIGAFQDSKIDLCFTSYVWLKRLRIMKVQIIMIIGREPRNKPFWLQSLFICYLTTI